MRHRLHIHDAGRDCKACKAGASGCGKPSITPAGPATSAVHVLTVGAVVIMVGCSTASVGANIVLAEQQLPPTVRGDRGGCWFT